MDGYTRYGHSIYRLVYHAVLVTKYRKPIISTEIMAFIKNYTKSLIEERYGGKLLDLYGCADYIHILFELPPTVIPTDIINIVKTQISKQARIKYSEQLSQQLQDDPFWSNSYFLSTSGTNDQKVIEKYIEEQGTPRPKRKYTLSKPRTRRKKEDLS